MADFGAPVASNIDVNPLQKLSDVLKIKSQQQALQGQAAEVSQAQQQNSELQQVQQVLGQVRQGKYRDKNGDLDSGKLSEDIAAIGPYAQQSASSVVSRANSMVENLNARQKLTEESRTELGNLMSSLASNPSTHIGDVQQGVTKFIQDHANDPYAIRVAVGQLAALPHDDGTPAFRSALSNFAGSLSGKSQSAPTSVATPAGTQPGQTMNATGGFTPAGPAIAAPPHQGVNAAGQTTNITPAGVVSVAPAATPAANPTTAQATVQNTAATGISQRVQQAQAAANSTVQAQDALTRARALLDQDSINTGKGFEFFRDLKNFMSGTLNIDTTGAKDANTLVKNLARYEAARATQAGLGGTDAARELAHNGSPNVQIDNAALKGIVTQALATEKALSAYANIQAKAGGDEQALIKNETAFRSIPNLIEGYEYGLARTPQEAEAFLKEHGLSAAEMKRTRAAIRQFEGQ